MSIWSSIGSTFSSGLAACCSSVSTALGSAGGFAARFTPLIGPVISTLDMLAKVANLVSVVLKVLGVFQADEKMEDMGDRALQAAEEGITCDKFEKYDDYTNAIRAFELDPEKSKTFSDQQKIMAGMSIGIRGAEEKLKAEKGALDSFIPVIAKDGNFFTPERTAAMVLAIKDVPAITAYFTGKLPPLEAGKLTERLCEVEHQRSPEKSERDIRAEINQARDLQQERKE